MIAPLLPKKPLYNLREEIMKTTNTPPAYSSGNNLYNCFIFALINRKKRPLISNKLIELFLYNDATSSWLSSFNVLEVKG